MGYMMNVGWWRIPWGDFQLWWWWQAFPGYIRIFMPWLMQNEWDKMVWEKSCFSHSGSNSLARSNLGQLALSGRIQPSFAENSKNLASHLLTDSFQQCPLYILILQNVHPSPYWQEFRKISKLDEKLSETSSACTKRLDPNLVSVDDIKPFLWNQISKGHNFLERKAKMAKMPSVPSLPIAHGANIQAWSVCWDRPNFAERQIVTDFD